MASSQPSSGRPRPHNHSHSHAGASPHPAQALTWSILRLTLLTRLAGAVALSAALWAIVAVAMS